MPVSAARCSSIQVQSGATREKRSVRPLARSTAVSWHVYRRDVRLRNCALQYADSSAPRVSVGASLIWDSPFGPLRFDFAYPILKQPYDRTQFFQFGGGARF